MFKNAAQAQAVKNAGRKAKAHVQKYQEAYLFGTGIAVGAALRGGRSTKIDVTVIAVADN